MKVIELLSLKMSLFILNCFNEFKFKNKVVTYRL